jgi:hypothetical protein
MVRASRGYPAHPFEYPPGTGQDFMVGTYSRCDKVHPMRIVQSQRRLRFCSARPRKSCQSIITTVGTRSAIISIRTP